jgi:TRAP-type C4-dicarboxylate transport system substrate-binding protein
LRFSNTAKFQKSRNREKEETDLKKLLFIVLAMVLALSVGLVGCAGEGEGEGETVWNYTIPLTFHPTISKFASIVGEAVNPWVAAVNALNGSQGGHFNVTIVSPGDSPFDAGSSLNALSIGTTDMGMLSPETFALGGAGYLPFEFDSPEECAYVMYNLWTEDNAKWDANGQMDGIKLLVVVPLWGSQMWTRATNVTTVADLSDLKIRTDAQAVESATLTAWGAAPTYLGVSEIADALTLGTIDATMFTYSGIGGAANLAKPVTNYTTELDIIYRPYAFAMCKAKWNALPAEAKTLLETVCGWQKSIDLAAAHHAAEGEDRNATDADRPIYVPTPEQKATFVDAVANVSTNWAAFMTDPLGYDGAGILARIAALKTAYGALP